MTLLDLAEETVATARKDLPERGARNSVTRAQLSLDLEIQRLRFYLGLEFGCEVEYVLDDVDLALDLLVHVDGDKDGYVDCYGQPTSIRDQVN